MKPALILSALILPAATHAQELKDKVLDDFLHQTSISGYIVGKAAFTDQDGKNHSDFQLRHVRASIGGKVMNVSYNFQVECAGTYGDTRTGMRLLDAWAEWNKFRQIKLKAGQFKRSFSFEGPMNPWNVDCGAYAQVSQKLVGFSDRVGEHSSGARDIGVQLQGDLLPVGKDKHTLLHYQVGVFNGQGINHNDANHAKDLIGGLWLSPVKGLDIAWFGWSGSYTDQGLTVDRNRMAYSLRYTGHHFYTRAEYMQSRGRKIKDAAITGSNLADGWYALFGYKQTRWRAAVKWDVYRDTKAWADDQSIYGASFTYMFCSNIQLMANYGFHDDRAAKDRYYHTFDVQAFLKF